MIISTFQVVAVHEMPYLGTSYQVPGTGCQVPGTGKENQLSPQWRGVVELMSFSALGFGLWAFGC